MKHIKFWILFKLLLGICGKTVDCKTCEMRLYLKNGKRECAVGCALAQARKVWGLDYENL